MEQLITWRKSRRSEEQGDACVEVADLGPWQKSRRSDEHGDACIEVAARAGAVGVRDSKDPEGPKLVLSRADYKALVNALKE
ncbi:MULTISPECIES: DUF397 domain-containing protein [Actinomadura]|uniref:DUF397 domain-containing protein n=1 Tax=Actinomadura yumaensis TaxID=111807 RepID=A0ABW2CPI4_9ACTN|nr:DUF397 domain-containing protein [Actinomadura sp. J1-007]MWK34293.1 DUF397 domain-containing protein [Actinomadura sp. J1-007]